MRKAIVVGILAVILVITLILWMINSERGLNTTSILMLSIQIVVVAFAILVIYRRVTAARQNLPAEDEMSKKILRRGAATSYYVSLYLWLALMFFEERIDLERSTLIGAGILGMAVIYALSWVYHSYLRQSHD